MSILFFTYNEGERPTGLLFSTHSRMIPNILSLKPGR